MNLTYICTPAGVQTPAYNLPILNCFVLKLDVILVPCWNGINLQDKS